MLYQLLWSSIFRRYRMYVYTMGTNVQAARIAPKIISVCKPISM